MTHVHAEEPLRESAARRSRPALPAWVGPALLGAAMLGLLVARPWLVARYDLAGVSTWSTVFVAIVLQALPFLVLGVVLSAVLAVYVPTRWITRALPRHPLASVGAASLSGAVLPGCECASVPLAGGMIRRGVPQAAALAFLLSAPALNPIVLAATAVAFPGRPEMVLARFLSAFTVSVVVALVWLRLFPDSMPKLPDRGPTEGTRWERFRGTIEHDVLHTGGFLVVGAAMAATVNVAIPRRWVEPVASDPVLGILALSLLAVIIAICSEADAFVAASLGSFSPTAQLAFMVVGPVVDIKLILMQAGVFGRRFATRFAPLSFAVAVPTAVVVGALLL